jgi:hypothetical protein
MLWGVGDGGAPVVLPLGAPLVPELGRDDALHDTGADAELTGNLEDADASGAQLKDTVSDSTT